MSFEKIVSHLADNGMKITFAESCTGGFLSKSLTDIPGTSAVYDGGIVTYSNSIKMRFLGVEKNVLDTYGAVSRQCAAQMAKGVRHLFGADIAVSVTGIAGPDGGTAEKPVGLVYVGICDKNGVSVYRLTCRNSGRDGVRTQTVKTVCRLIEERLGI